MSDYSRGSEWRRWDLHIHTPGTVKSDCFEGSSNEEKWEKYYSDISDYIGDGTDPAKNIAAIGITDYLSIDNYRKVVTDSKLPQSIKLVLPNIEMRMYPLSKQNGINIHFIFDPSIVDELNDRFFSQLHIEHGGRKFTAVKNSLIALGKVISPEIEDDEIAYRKGIGQFIPTCNSIKDIFDTDSLLREKTIIVVSNSSNDGVSGAANHCCYFNSSIKGSDFDATRQFIYQFSDAIFSANEKDVSYFLGAGADSIEEVVKKCGSIKPCIHGSDAHTNSKILEPADKKYCWIKADSTFNGLRQIIFEPKERVFIGDIPPSLDRLNKNKQNYILSVSVNRITNPKNKAETWFDFNLPLNSGLVSIIGNKGSGKSAISDIIGHFSNCKTMGSASFLNSERFRKGSKGYAQDYEGSLTWYDGQVDEKVSLQYSSRSVAIENAQYLPQRYIEDICNDLGNGFRDEINRVIFSYVDITERGNTSNLEQLIQQKSVAIGEAIDTKLKELEIINRNIIALEEKLATSYMKAQKEGLAKCKEKLERHIKNKPEEVKNDSANNDPEYVRELEKVDKKINALNTEISQKSLRLTEVNIAIDALKATRIRVVSCKTEVEKINRELLEASSKYEIVGLAIEANFDVPLEKIKVRIEEFLDEKRQISLMLDSSENAESAISLYKKLAVEKIEKDKLILTSDVKEKAYQKYIDDLKSWEVQTKNIVGSKIEPDTLEFYKNEVEYVENNLASAYELLLATRLEKIKSIFDLKIEIATIYSTIYSPVEKQLNLLVGDMDDQIDFASELSLSNVNVGEELLVYINKTFGGIFNGSAAASSKMAAWIKDTDFNSWDGIKLFILDVLKVVSEDYDSASKKIKDKGEFYDKLCELKYISAQYNLKVGGRSLDELSPGEKGIVLLIFYLALSKDERPLIIDQPEDNLDNQSVFCKLVKCITEAKKKRQVIIVTHNPNIAVACDSEQLIYCSIDKTNNSISYSSGSIEDPDMRKHVIDVLEGTMPAFDLRRRKYQINP